MKRAIVLLAAATLLGLGTASGAAPFELADGDRVVLIGGTLIERDQASGYLETRLVRRHPGLSLTFRNLGWSGDTVRGISRARFGPPAEGFKHLVDHVLALKPTVIVLGYGANEAFEGAAGLPGFLKGLDTLLAALAPSKARLVFLGPNRQEDLGRPLPDPTAHNADLALYRVALREVAASRGAPFVDLFEAIPDGARATPRRPLTDNGIHFNVRGYWCEAAAIEKDLNRGKTGVEGASAIAGLGPILVNLNFETDIKNPEATPGGIRFRLIDEMLPAPPPPDAVPDPVTRGRVIQVWDLKPGRYALKVDGKPVTTADASAWDAGVKLTQGPEFDQVEALRSAINAKNQLYFHRWRPENETYLFGFRKHEQGRNAAEIVEFDPLIAAREEQIARLRVPVAHSYELTREGEVGR